MRCSVANLVNQKGLPCGMAILTLYHWDLHNQEGGFSPITRNTCYQQRESMGPEVGQETCAGCKLYLKMTIMRKSMLEVKELMDEIQI